MKYEIFLVGLIFLKKDAMTSKAHETLALLAIAVFWHQRLAGLI